MSPLTDEQRQQAQEEDEGLAGTASGFSFTPGFDSGSELTDKFSGAGIADTIVLLNKGIQEDNDAVMAAAGVALGLDTVALVLNPFGSLIAAGVGWLIDHVFFLREPLDMLMGDNMAIAAQTKRIKAEGEEYTTRISVDHKTAVDKIQNWKGKAADAFRADMEMVRDELNAVGEALKGLADIMSKMGACVTGFRSVVRDIIANVLGGLIGGAIAAAAMMPFTFGASIAVFVTSAIGVAVSALAKIMGLVSKLTSILGRNVGNAGKVGGKLGGVASGAGRQHAPVPKPAPRSGPPPAGKQDPPPSPTGAPPKDSASTSPSGSPGGPKPPPTTTPPPPKDPAPTTPSGAPGAGPKPPTTPPPPPAPTRPPPPPPAPTRPPPPPPPTSPPPPPPVAPPKPPPAKPPAKPANPFAKLPIKQRMDALNNVTDQALAKTLVDKFGKSYDEAYKIVRVLRNIEGVAAPGGSIQIGGRSYASGDLLHASHELWKEHGGNA